MKRLVISIIGLLIAMTMTATGQQGDVQRMLRQERPLDSNR